MYLSYVRPADLPGTVDILKSPPNDRPTTARDPKIVERVSAILHDVEVGGLDAVMRYARELDGWDNPTIEFGPAALAESAAKLPAELRAALDLGLERTQKFALAQKSHLCDFEAELAPGVFAGQRYLPVGRVGAYLPGGRFPILASAFMTVGVAKAAGVPTVVACTPPGPSGTPDPGVLYAAQIAGADRVFALGGVQALAAMAFGLLDEAPVDMLVGAGNAYVTEAKRQLFGRVALDLLAGPSEVAIIADDSSDAELVAADLLGQAEHGPESPAALVTTSRSLAEAVIVEIERQLETLKTKDIAGPAWRDFGIVAVVSDPDTAIALMDQLAPEHLELQTTDDGYYYERLQNYGSVFIGRWSTVAYSDKGMGGTNHTLPTAAGARHSAGLSVSRYLKPLTYQRVERESTHLLADAVDVIAEYEGMAAHRETAVIRKVRLSQPDVAVDLPRTAGEASVRR